MTMTMIQVILYLSVAFHLVHCLPIHSRSRRDSDLEPNCTDINEFNQIFNWNDGSLNVRPNNTVL